MAKKCGYEGCENTQFGGGYCKFHQWLRDDICRELSKVSDTRTEESKIYFEERDRFLSLPENEFCQIKAEGCTIYAEVVHHRNGRTIHYLSVWTWIASCRNCNNHVEKEHKWAEENGFKGSKFLTTINPDLSPP